MSLPCLESFKCVWPIQTLSADFLSELGGFCWDCLVKRYELSGNNSVPLSVNEKRITNFKEKANLFNKYFSSQCNPLPNDSKLPEN